MFDLAIHSGIAQDLVDRRFDAHAPWWAYAPAAPGARPARGRRALVHVLRAVADRLEPARRYAAQG